MPSWQVLLQVVSCSCVLACGRLLGQLWWEECCW
jgi:hypothetical protein